MALKGKKKKAASDNVDVSPSLDHETLINTDNEKEDNDIQILEKRKRDSSEDRSSTEDEPLCDEPNPKHARTSVAERIEHNLAPKLIHDQPDGSFNRQSIFHPSGSSAKNESFGEAMKRMGIQVLQPKAQGLDEGRIKETDLPSLCEVTDEALQDIALADHYNNLPPLRAAILKSSSTNPGRSIGHVMFHTWGQVCPDMHFQNALQSLAFVQNGHFVNPSRVSPTLVSVRDMGDGSRLRLYVGSSLAMCMTPVRVYDSRLQEVNSVTHVKEIRGRLHSQEFERFVGFFGTVFRKPMLRTTMYEDAVSFSTMRLADDGSTKPANLMDDPPKNAFVLEAKVAIPVFDARHHIINFDTDLQDLSKFPRWGTEVPKDSFAIVGYTVGIGQAKTNKDWYLNLNLQWAVVLGTPSDRG